MSNLFIFGDSFSAEWETNHSEPHYRPSGQRFYAKKYYEKHNRYPIHFQDIIKTELNCENIINHSGYGYCNYSIMDSIGKYINDIKENDIVVIGWSNIARWRFVHSKKKDWQIVWPNTEKEKYPHGFHEQSVHRYCSVTMQELINWQNILSKSLPKNTLFWSPWIYDGNEDFHTLSNINKPELIRESDIKKIDDYHYSENGMKTIGNWLIKLIKNE